MNQYRRDILSDYVRTMRIHASTMAEYNRNMTNMMRMWETTSTTPANSRSNSSDIASVLLYLSQLNTDYGTLTTEQITDATEMIRYSEHDSSLENAARSCPISLDEFQEGEMVCRIRHCGHIFKRDNLMQWFSTHTCCPVCRHNIATSENNEQPQPLVDILTRMFDMSNADVSGNYTYTFDLPLTRRR